MDERLFRAILRAGRVHRSDRGSLVKDGLITSVVPVASTLVGGKDKIEKPVQWPERALWGLKSGRNSGSGAGLNAQAHLGATVIPCPPVNLPGMRPWRDIARELARETDRTRICELAEELNRAMEEQRAAESFHAPPAPTR